MTLVRCKEMMPCLFCPLRVFLFLQNGSQVVSGGGALLLCSIDPATDDFPQMD